MIVQVILHDGEGMMYLRWLTSDMGTSRSRMRNVLANALFTHTWVHFQYVVRLNLDQARASRLLRCRFITNPR